MVASPENTKLMLPAPLAALVVLGLVVVLVELVALPTVAPEEELRSSIQGTTTCLPLPVKLLVVLPGVVVVVPGVVVALGVVVVAPGVVVLPRVVPAELTDRTAKSTRPDVGLMITSLSVPRFCPEELVTCAPSNCEARKCCCCPIRPVALSPWLVEDWRCPLGLW